MPTYTSGRVDSLANKQIAPQNSNVTARKNQLETLNAVVVPSVPTTQPPRHG